MFKSRRCGEPKIQTLPSHRIIPEFSLYRLAPWLLVTGACESFPASVFLWQWCTNAFWSKLVTCDYQATPWKVGAGTLDWDQGHIFNDPPGPLSEPGRRRPSGLLPFIHPALTLSSSSSLSPWASSFPLHEQLTLPRIHFSALCSLELSFNKVRQTPTHLSNPKSFLFFQEAFPDCSNHLLFYSHAEQSTQLSHIT